MYGYCSEITYSNNSINIPDGNYQAVNALNRGTLIENNTITIKGSNGLKNTISIQEFEKISGEKAVDFLKRQTKASIDLNDALSKFELEEDTIMYRGVNFDALEAYGVLPNDSAATIINKIKKSGGAYHDNGFMSAAIEPTPITYGKSIMFELNCKKGTKGAFMESFNQFGENEFLLMSDQKFAIDSAENKNGQIIIKMISLNK